LYHSHFSINTLKASANSKAQYSYPEGRNLYRKTLCENEGLIYQKTFVGTRKSAFWIAFVIAIAFLSTLRLGRQAYSLVSFGLCGLLMCMTEKCRFIVVDQLLRFLMLILQKHFHVFVLMVLFLRTFPVLQHLTQIL
jgi:hypothetical protein